MIAFTIPGEVIPQLRPRFARLPNGGVRAYDPRKCSSYKEFVAWSAVTVKPDRPIEGPVAVTIRVYKNPPGSWAKSKIAMALAGMLYPTSKPDADNLAKGICDALKGVIWKDDAQVVRLLVEKHYAQEQRAEVEIEEVCTHA